MHITSRILSGRAIGLAGTCCLNNTERPIYLIFYHALINCDMFDGHLSTDQILLHNSQNVLDLEQRIIPMCTFWLTVIVIAEMNIPTHEGKCIPCHNITKMWDVYTIATLPVETDGRRIIKPKLRSL